MTTQHITTSLARVKGKVQLAHTHGRNLLSMAKKFKEMHTGQWIVSLMGKRRIERCQCMNQDLVHLQVKNIKTIEELPKLTEEILGKRKKQDGEEEEDGMWNKKSIL
jgi:hypothetical protein